MRCIMGNKNLHNAKMAKNDEFYTQYSDIQKEVDAYLEYNPNVFKDKTVLLPCDDPEWSNFTKFFVQNFEKFGLKKLISTSYAYETKLEKYGQLDLFEDSDYILNNSNYNSKIDKKLGKIFTLTRKNKKVDIDNLEWNYLDGDGDFRSSEIKALRDESDFIITNPPFSLFREFVAWIMEANKKFIIIGTQNAITYKEVFPLLKDNKIWLGKGFKSMVGHFINKFYTDYATASDHQEGMIRVSGVVWFTNLEHGRRHKPLSLLTKDDNLKFNKKLQNPKYQSAYAKYDNYDAIEIPLTEAIPSDYEGVMGVPISFLNKFCPEQFEILGMESSAGYDKKIVGLDLLIPGDARPSIKNKTTFARIFIRKIK